MFPTLIPNAVLRRRIAEMAVRVAQDAPEEPPLLIAVLEGARVFSDHLSRLLPGKPKYRCIRAKSYGSGTVSSGSVKVVATEKIDVAGRRVLLLEDIVDTGNTVAALRKHFEAEGADRVQVASLLSKPSRRQVDVVVDYIGFEIPDEFVIGFGMDFDGKYRDLDSVVVYKPELEASLG